jgi:hypothetical protein
MIVGILYAIITEFIIIGLGWRNVRKTIYSAAQQTHGTKLTGMASEGVSQLLLFIPLARMYTLLYMYDDLIDIVDIKARTLKSLKKELSADVIEVRKVAAKNKILGEDD